MATNIAMFPQLHRRLLSDFAELQQDPYPNVHLQINEADITQACLMLTPPGQKPLHLTVKFNDRYTLEAPMVCIQSQVEHPNVFPGGYICATILNTHEGWSPTYTLRGVLIQLLSFFMSDSIEQDYEDGHTVDLGAYRAQMERRKLMRLNTTYGRFGGLINSHRQYRCKFCGFDGNWTPPVTATASSSQNRAVVRGHPRSKLYNLPDELILHLLSFLDTKDIMCLAEGVPAIGQMLNSFDFIRMRELQCFCLKTSFLETRLGIGVSIVKGRKPEFRSEFDLLSREAYNLNVRKSVQGVSFDRWLPLPLSHRHWRSVRSDAEYELEGLRHAGKLDNENKVAVLYHFMNTVVVQFSRDADKTYTKMADSRSTLTHVSEKAVEAYFSLFHLLLCVATEDSAVVLAANRKISRFVAGPRTKAQFPDLGHVLVAALISDSGLTPDLTLHVIKEAILRNVVWMLDEKGVGMAELAYLEPSDVSAYRLARTFEASTTSYRLLMFLKLFSSAARTSGKSMVQLRDQLFETHGAPPSGISSAMAQKIQARA
jgi:ubiquitin-protein ligase